MITDDRIFLTGLHKPAVEPARLTLTSAPAVEPWLATDAEVQQMLRLDSDADAALVTLVLKSARRYFEKITGLALITQSWRASFDRIPRGPVDYMPTFVGLGGWTREIPFPRTPLQTIDAVSYLDTAGATQTFSAANYTAGNIGYARDFGRLMLNETASWPDLGVYPGAFKIDFTCGFGDAADDIPEEARLALLFLAAHWYENHLPLDADGAVAMPLHLESLIEMNRVTFIA